MSPMPTFSGSQWTGSLGSSCPAGVAAEAHLCCPNFAVSSVLRPRGVVNDYKRRSR
jgi:hypothetical protein